jgi:hypothetical protein
MFSNVTKRFYSSFSTNKHSRWVQRASILGMGCSLWLLSTSARAATYMVTNNQPSGPGSLRDAIIAANADANLDDILFANNVTGEIGLNASDGEFLITNAVNIIGPGADRLAISGNDISRVFHITNNVPVHIEHLTILHGSAQQPMDFDGGGIFVESGTLTLQSSRVTNNFANGSGGGIFCGPVGFLTIRNSLIDHNTATVAGGIETQAGIDLLSSTVAHNSSQIHTGGVFIAPLADMNVTESHVYNTTIAYNTCSGTGCSVTGLNANNPYIYLRNSIIVGNQNNSSAGMYEIDGFLFNADNNLIGLSSPLLSPSFPVNSLNVQSSAVFDESSFDQVNGFISDQGGPFPSIPIAANSPSIDAGFNQPPTDPLATLTDERGFARITARIFGGNPVQDIGASEVSSDRVYVAKNSPGPLTDGLTWQTAFLELNRAVKYAHPDTEIWVTAGTYYPIDLLPGTMPTPTQQQVAFRPRPGVGIYGGFSGPSSSGGGETDKGQRDLFTNHTMLSGDIDKNDATSPVPNSDTIVGANSHSVVELSGGSLMLPFTLDGVTVSGANSTDNSTGATGGGIKTSQAEVKLNHVIIQGNKSITAGGGMSIKGGSTSLKNCSFIGNRSNIKGGGLAISTEVVLDMENVDISNNDAPQGGGISLDVNVDATADRLVITNNHSLNVTESYGGGLFMGFSTNLSLFNSLIAKNASENKGGGLFLSSGSTLYLINDTIADNSAVYGGAIYNYYDTQLGFNPNSLTIANSIVSGNATTTPNEPSIQSFDNAGVPAVGPTISYTSTQDPLPANGMDGGNNLVNVNPLFVNPQSGNYHLQSGSPAINVGNNSINVYPFDLDGQARIAATIIDLGAYEFSPNSPPGFTNNPPTVNLTVGVPFHYIVNVADPDNDNLTLQFQMVPMWLNNSVMGNGTPNPVGDLSGTPGPNDVGKFDVSMSLSDGKAPPVVKGFTLIVSPANGAGGMGGASGSAGMAGGTPNGSGGSAGNAGQNTGTIPALWGESEPGLGIAGNGNSPYGSLPGAPTGGSSSTSNGDQRPSVDPPISTSCSVSTGSLGASQSSTWNWLVSLLLLTLLGRNRNREN